MLQQQEGELGSVAWHKPQELDQPARRADDSPEGLLITVSWQVLLLCTCSDAATNRCLSSRAQGSKTGTCISVSASSRRTRPPHRCGSHILQNRSMLMCQVRRSQESNSKSPSPCQLDPAALGISRVEQQRTALLAVPSTGDVGNIGGPPQWTWWISNLQGWSRASCSLLKVSLWV